MLHFTLGLECHPLLLTQDTGKTVSGPPNCTSIFYFWLPFVWGFLSFHRPFEWHSWRLWFRPVSSLNALVKVPGLFWCPFRGRCFEECSDSWCNDGFQFPYLSSEDLDVMTPECLPSQIVCEPLLWNKRYEHTKKHHKVRSLLLLCFPLHHITN